jgi:geranylgeranyl diphosphate synthase type I
VAVHPVDAETSSAAERYLDLVEQELHDVLDEQRRRVRDLAREAVLLVDEVARTLAAGGKRIRPLFCYWGYRAAGGEDGPPIAMAGAALELLHTSALIHDDVMDRSHFRRGQPTAFRMLARERTPPPVEGADPDERFGRAAAILAGDLAQAFADELLADSGFDTARLMEAFRHFNDMRVQAVAGELLDVLLARRGEADEAAARRVAILKSASYTVVGPLLLGAALGGAEPRVREVLARYGWPLGEAFQLRDDVLGTFGDPALTGKDRDTDIREGKQTALVAKARRLADPSDGALLDDWLGREGLPPDQVEAVRAVIRSSGALEETVGLIEALTGEAVAALAGAPLASEVARALEDLAAVVALREA